MSETDLTINRERWSGISEDERNAQMYEWIGDRDAITWFIAFNKVVNYFDDIIDKDRYPETKESFDVIYNIFVDLYMNPFFSKNATFLLPIINSGIADSETATQLENGAWPHRKALEVSHVLRGFQMTMLRTVIELTRGREFLRALGPDTVEFVFGKLESLDEYITEHQDKFTRGIFDDGT